MNIQIRILDEKVRSLLPTYATHGSAAVDLRAILENTITLNPGDCELVGTGIAIYIQDPAYAAMILPRSGLGHKNGLVLGNGIGLIDSDYQGELKVSCYNRSKKPLVIEPLIRFAQLVIFPVKQVRFALVDEFKLTDRGDMGFGHSGEK